MRAPLRFALTPVVAALAVGLSATILAAGCKKSAPPPPPKPGAPAGGMAGEADPGEEPGKGAVVGTVLESKDAASYTYLKLKTAKGEVWAAVPHAEVKPGQRVRVLNAQPMRNFPSKALNKTFELVYFGRLAGPGAGHGKGGMAPHGPGGPGGASPADIRKQHAKLQGTKATFEKPVAKAAGPSGRTVAEIYAQREALKGKPVAVRGKVVKFNRNILGQNWLHLQDGSGTADDFDLTVTTKAEAKVGDLVLVEGTLATEKSFGAGYSYKVILEQAKVTEEK